MSSVTTANFKNVSVQLKKNSYYIVLGIGNQLNGKVFTIYNTKSLSKNQINSCAYWKYEVSYSCMKSI